MATTIDYTKGSLDTTGFSANNNLSPNKNPKPIFNDTGDKDVSMDDLVIVDKKWIATRFMVSDIQLSDPDNINRYFSSAHTKFTDSSLGGNLGINTRSGFTPYADIPIQGKRSDRVFPSTNGLATTYGMGRYYSEAIDDNEQVIFMEFGVPKFNSLFDFFTKAVDYSDSVLATTGRKPYAYNIGKAIGAGVMLAAFPLITTTIWITKAIFGLLAGHNAFNYYYMEPTMHTYWGTVNQIVTMMATEMGILIPTFNPNNDDNKAMGVNVVIDQDEMNQLKALWPNIIGDTNYIDVFAIATKAQASANAQALIDRDVYNQMTGKDSYDENIKNIENGTNGAANADIINGSAYKKYVDEHYQFGRINADGTAYQMTFSQNVNDATMFSSYLNKITGAGPKPNNSLYFAQPDEADKPAPGPQAQSASATNNNEVEQTTVKDFKRNSDGTYPAPDQTTMDKISSFVSSIDSTVRDGAMHAIFRVDFTGSVTESFTNGTEDIELGDTLKSLSKKSRDVKFSLSGGNILGQNLDEMIGQAKDLIAGGLDSITYGASNVLQTLLGGGYIDIPKKWSDSDMNMSSVTYSMQLVSPYGNTISQLKNIYIPLAMIMAGTLPLATGKASYTSPFLCSIFSKGVQNIKLGMITSLSITRGTSNLAFNKDRRALAIDVSFTVTDFSNILAAPINTSIFDEVFNVFLNDDSPFGNYISVLGSRNILTNKYMIPKLKLKMSRIAMAANQAVSPSSWGMRVGENLNGILGGFVSQRALSNKGTM